jgi:adenine-specific DNA-methyltransferase
LIVAKELLTDSGSIFVQISDENVHRVRLLLDEIFGIENYCGEIVFRKTTGKGGALVDSTYDLLLWYARDRDSVRYNSLYFRRNPSDDANYRLVELPNGSRRSLTQQERKQVDLLTELCVFSPNPLTSQSASSTTLFEHEFEGDSYRPGKGGWKTNEEGMHRLHKSRRLMGIGNTLRFIRYFEDFPYQAYNNIWDDTSTTTRLH